ncbi:MAG: hypothetical protein ACRD0K_13525 [Egibacteraceae bacterium]
MAAQQTQDWRLDYEHESKKTQEEWSKAWIDIVDQTFDFAFHLLAWQRKFAYSVIHAVPAFYGTEKPKPMPYTPPPPAPHDE